MRVTLSSAIFVYKTQLMVLVQIRCRPAQIHPSLKQDTKRKEVLTSKLQNTFVDSSHSPERLLCQQIRFKFAYQENTFRFKL